MTKTLKPSDGCAFFTLQDFAFQINEDPAETEFIIQGNIPDNFSSNITQQMVEDFQKIKTLTFTSHIGSRAFINVPFLGLQALFISNSLARLKVGENAFDAVHFQNLKVLSLQDVDVGDEAFKDATFQSLSLLMLIGSTIKPTTFQTTTTQGKYFSLMGIYTIQMILPYF